MKQLFRPEVNTYFRCIIAPRGGEPFLIEIDDSADVVIAAHVNGFRRELGLTVKGAREIAKIAGWREVVR